jgi:hypothetical protein
MRIASTTKLDFWVFGVLVATAIVAGRGTPGVEVPTTRELQAAVLSNGFAVMEGAPTDRHVISVDWDGGNAKRRAVPVIVPEARVVGTSGGITVGWLENKKVLLAKVTGDGTLGEASVWGKRVKQLCDGTVASEEQWGVGFLENDGRVWIVYGPTKKRAVAEGFGDLTATTRTVWCGVTAAGKKVGLMGRDQHNKMWLGLCDGKGCAASVRVPLSKKETFAGIACHEARCLMVARDAKGIANLGWFTTPQGRLTWWKPLSDATPDTTFSVTAAGPDAFAVGYVTREGATAIRVIESGSMVRAWADPYSSNAPALAWANDRLLVAHRHDSSVAPEVVPLPR